MDIEWEAPPEEDIDTMLDDEDELEYIREIEMERRRKEQDDLEKMLNSDTQVAKRYPHGHSKIKTYFKSYLRLNISIPFSVKTTFLI